MVLNARDHGPFIIAGGIAAAGFFIAIALFLSRASDGPPPSPPPAVATDVAPAPPPATIAPAVDFAAANAATQANLNQVMTAALEAFAVNGSFAGETPTVLVTQVPTMTFLRAENASTMPTVISVSSQDLTFSAAAHSESGTCFWIKATSPGAEEIPVTSFGVGLPCTGQAAEASALPTWTP